MSWCTVVKVVPLLATEFSWSVQLCVHMSFRHYCTSFQPFSLWISLLCCSVTIENVVCNRVLKCHNLCSPGFSVMWGSLGPVNLELSRFYCISYLPNYQIPPPSHQSSRKYTYRMCLSLWEIVRKCHLSEWWVREKSLSLLWWIQYSMMLQVSLTLVFKSTAFWRNFDSWCYWVFFMVGLK